MAQIQQDKDWIKLCHDDDRARGVSVETKDGDRFFLSVDDAIKACKDRSNANEFIQQLEGVFDRVSSWLNRHPGKIARAYLSISAEGVDFTIVLRDKELDQEVDESLVDLDIEIAQSEEFDLIKLDVMSLPFCSNESSRSFVRPELTWMREMLPR